MPTFPVRFVGDVGNLGSFAGQIEQSIVGAERAIESAFARLASKQTGVPKMSPMSMAPPNMPGTFLNTSNVEFDRMNNRITAQVQAIQRSITGYRVEPMPTGNYEVVPNVSDSVIKELSLISNAYTSFTSKLQSTAVINNLLSNQQRSFKQTEADLRNLSQGYRNAGEAAATALRRNPAAGQIDLMAPGASKYVPMAIQAVPTTGVLAQITALEKRYGVDLKEAKQRVINLGRTVSDFDWVEKKTYKKPERGELSRGAPELQSYTATLSPTAVLRGAQKYAQVIDDEVVPMITRAMDDAGTKIINSPGAKRLSTAAETAFLSGAGLLGREEQNFIKRFPTVVQQLQRQGLGGGAKLGTPAFFQNVASQDFKVGEVYKDFERNIVRVSGTMRDASGIAGQWSYALDHNGNVINRWGNRLIGARGILNQTGRDFLKVIEWTVATSVVFGALGTAIRSITQINTLNEDLQRFSITAKLTGENTDQMFRRIADVAYATATPLTELVKAADDIALATRKSNQSSIEWQQEIIDLTRAVGILTNISGLDTVQATDLLTASMKQLGLTAAETLGVLNKAAAAAGGQANAITDIFQALGTVTEAADAANMSLDEQIASVQVIAQVTGKTAADVATAFKNLFGALASPGAEKKLEEFGIAVRDAEGNIRPFLEVYKDISVALKTGVIPEGRLNEVLRAISGGPRRAPDAAALLGNISKVYEVTGIAANATNEALIANAKILDTNNAKLRQLQVSVDTQVFEKLNETIAGLTDVLLTLAQAFAAAFGAVPAGVYQLAIQLGIILTTATLLGKVFNSIGNSFFISRFLRGVGLRKAPILDDLSGSSVSGYNPAAYMRNEKGVAREKSAVIGAASSFGVSTRGPISYGATTSASEFPTGYSAWRYGSRTTHSPRLMSTLRSPEAISTAHEARIRQRYAQRLREIQNLTMTRMEDDVLLALDRQAATIRGGISRGNPDIAVSMLRLRQIERLRRSYINNSSGIFNTLPSLVPAAEAAAYRSQGPLGVQGYGRTRLQRDLQIYRSAAQSDYSKERLEMLRDLDRRYGRSAFVPSRATEGLKAVQDAGEAAVGKRIKTAATQYYQDAFGRLFRTTINGIDQKDIITRASGGIAPTIVSVAGETSKSLVAATVSSWTAALSKGLRTTGGKAGIGGLAGVGIVGAGLAATGGDQGVASLLQGVGMSTTMMGFAGGPAAPFIVGAGIAITGLATAYQMLTAEQEKNKQAVNELRQASYDAFQQYRIDMAGYEATTGDLELIQDSLSKSTKGSQEYINLQKQYGEQIVEVIAAQTQLNSSFNVLKKAIIDLADKSKQSGEDISSSLKNTADFLRTGMPVSSLPADMQKDILKDLSREILRESGVTVYEAPVAPIRGSFYGGGGSTGTTYTTEQKTPKIGGGEVITRVTKDLMDIGLEDLRNLINNLDTAEIAKTNLNFTLLRSRLEKYSSEMSPDEAQKLRDALGRWANSANLGVAEATNLFATMRGNAEAQKMLGVSVEETGRMLSRISVAEKIFLTAIENNQTRRTAASNETTPTSSERRRTSERRAALDRGKAIINEVLFSEDLISKEQAVEFWKQLSEVDPETFSPNLDPAAMESAAVAFFAPIVRVAEESSISVQEAFDLKGKIFNSMSSSVEDLNQKLLELEGRKLGGEFTKEVNGKIKVDLTPYNELRGQYTSLIETVTTLNDLWQTMTPEALDMVATAIDENVTGFDSLITKTKDLETGTEIVTKNWDQFGQMLIAVSNTMGLSGKQVDTLKGKLILLSKMAEYMKQVELGVAKATVTSAMAFGYQARAAALAGRAMGATFNIIRTGEAGSTQQAQLDLTRIYNDARTFLSGFDFADAIQNIFSDIGGIFAGGAGSGFGSGSGSGSSGGTKKGPDISELDIPKEIFEAYNRDALLKEAVRRATELQSKIPGAKKEAADDIVELLYGTKRVMEVRGVREDLLRRAIEELADIEKKRLDFETKADIIQRIRVGAGSFAAIANVPLNSQTGVSVGSPQGPITVNLNVTGGALTPAQLEEWANMVGSVIKRQIGGG